MPGMNRTGPDGLGPMTGRGRGACGTAAGMGRGFGGGMGFGRGFGGARGAFRGAERGVGPGRGLGWFSVGYNDAGNTEYGTDIKSALEARSAFLRAELARTEALLAAGVKEDAGE